jgi:hypothetical protein
VRSTDALRRATAGGSAAPEARGAGPHRVRAGALGFAVPSGMTAVWAWPALREPVIIVAAAVDDAVSCGVRLAPGRAV